MTQTGSERPLINYKVQREFFYKNREAILEGKPIDSAGAAEAGPRGAFTVRAQVRLLQDCLKEVRVGQFRFLSDEGPPRGWGAAPAPLHFLIAAVGL